MAEGCDDKKLALEDLEKEITCAQCNDFYQQPKLLSCNHYYCLNCIQKLTDNCDGKPLNCPKCQGETIISSNGAASLQSAFFVERMKDIYYKVAKMEGKIESLCEQCTAANLAVSFCRQCAEFVCAECVISHKNLKIFVGHVVMTMGELKERGHKDIPLKVTPPIQCDVHCQEVGLFCFDCNKLICCDCTIVDHRQHKFEFLKKCAPKSRDNLRDFLQPLREILVNLERAENSNRLVHSRVDNKKDDTVRSIEQCLSKAMDLFQQKKTLLTKEVEVLARERKDILVVERKKLEQSKKEICYLIGFVEKNLEGTNDQDLMTIYTMLEKCIEKEAIHQKQFLPYTTAVTCDIGFTSSPPLLMSDSVCEIFDQHTPHVYHTFDAIVSRSTANGYLTSVMLGSEIKVTLSAPLVSQKEISAELQCVTTPQYSMRAKVFEGQSGVFKITATPQVRGQHQLIVQVKEKEIGQSAFRFFVLRPAVNLGKMYERKIPKLENPTGIAVNSQGQLMVIISAYDCKKVCILKRDGTRKQVIQCDHFRKPSSLASGLDGSIYVTDIGSKRLFKFNSKGELQKTVIDEFNKPVSVKIINHHVFVLDAKDNNVKIFDANCYYRGVIKVKECPKPNDIALGPDGLYVAGDDTISVYNLAPNGEFVYNVKLLYKGLSKFQGIAFSHDGKIIVSAYKYGVCILENDGNLVNHFSTGLIITPTGVAVDEDGFIYVCSSDTGNVFVL